MRLVFLLSVLALLGACGPSIDANDAAAVATATTVETGSDGVRMVTAPAVGGDWVSGSETASLTARVRPQAAVEVVLDIRVCCNRGEVRWVRTPEGRLSFTQETIFAQTAIPQTVGGITIYTATPMHTLTFQVPLTLDQVEAAGANGLALSYLDANFVKNVNVPAPYFRAFLDALGPVP